MTILHYLRLSLDMYQLLQKLHCCMQYPTHNTSHYVTRCASYRPCCLFTVCSLRILSRLLSIFGLNYVNCSIENCCAHYLTSVLYIFSLFSYFYAQVLMCWFIYFILNIIFSGNKLGSINSFLKPIFAGRN